MSTRLVAGLWYMFTTIMVSAYTANLAASLTAERMDTPIQNVKDLADQNEISYGCVKGGSTCSFFMVVWNWPLNEYCLLYTSDAADE